MMKGLRKGLLEKFFLGLITSCLVSGCIPENIILPIAESDNVEKKETIEEKYLPIPSGAVDLGLSVYWAACNVGAESPENYGDYYAWGETEEKNNFLISTYEFCNDSRVRKYCTNSSYGVVDNKIILEFMDDVASTKILGPWRMPTLEEIMELKEKCSWNWTTQNGSNGYLITGTNGKSIFLPAAGYRHGKEVYNQGTSGYYWSAVLNAGNCNYAYYLFFYEDSYDRSNERRFYGQTVRPVTNKKVKNIKNIE